jgi:FkbM family methyltransferase
LRSEVAKHSTEGERLRSEVARHSTEAERLRSEVARQHTEAGELRAESLRRDSEAQHLRAEAARHRSEAEAAQAATQYAWRAFRVASVKSSQLERDTADLLTRAEQRAELAKTDASAAVARAEELERALIQASAERDGLLASTCWRATWPVRVIGQHLPPNMRRAVRGGAKLAWWAATMKLPRKLRGRREALQANRQVAFDKPPGSLTSGSPQLDTDSIGGSEPVSDPDSLLRAPAMKLPEPEVVPPAISPVARGRPGEVTIRTAEALSRIPWQSHTGQLMRAIDQAEAEYLAAKLNSVRTASGELLAELQGAMSAWTLDEAGGARTDALVRALGVTPIYEPSMAPAAELPTPILRRYRKAQIATSRRLCFDPGNVGTIDGPIVISILLPVYKTPLVYLERAILSVVCQTYRSWQLCIVDSGSSDSAITAALNYYEALDTRIRVARLPQNAGVSATTNLALEMASGSYIGLLDHDDMITCDTLETIADHINQNPTIDLLYTDECKIDENDIVQQLMPKPDWSPLLLTAFMYTGHFSVYRASIVRQLGGLRSRYDLAQDYDLVLRVADLNPKVAHIRGYHYGWRMVRGSASLGGKPNARERNIAALQDAIDRRGWNGTVAALPTANRVVRPIEHEQSLVSIIIPSDNSTHIEECIKSIRGSTGYPEWEIIVVTNSTIAAAGKNLEDKNVSFVRYDKPFNFSDKCNLGAATARGEFVIFYNDDVRVITPDWIDAILECLTLPGVGAVTPKLLYRDNRIQHAGMVTGTRRLVGTAFHAYPHDTPANMNLAQSVREVSLLSAACLAMRKTLFEELGGFDAVNTPREHSDIDLCFRIREHGYSCVYTPHAKLTHFGHISMGAAETAGKGAYRTKHDVFIIKRFGQFLSDDPYFPKPMRDILSTESQEEFILFPRKSAPAEETKAGIAAASHFPATLDILIISHELTESGAPRAAFDLARVLRAAGHFVVVASPGDGPYRERLREVGVDVIIDELLLSQQGHVRDFARNFDKVICNTIVCWPAVAQLHEVVETYWYVHESELIREFVDNVPGFTEILKKPVPIWADSRLAARYLAAYGVASKIIEYGIDDPADARRPAVVDAKKVVIGVFGTYEPRKGQDLCIGAMLSLPQALRDRAELRLFGRTLPMFESHVAGLRQIADGDPSIVFCGEVEHDECLRQMAACDVILVPSRDDAMSFVALDALSLGKALVCSSTTGASEYLQDDQSAVILHGNTSEEISVVLAGLITNPALRETLGVGARQIYENTFRLDKFAENIHTALRIDRAPAQYKPMEIATPCPIKSSWSIEGEDVVCKFLLDHLFQGTINDRFFIDVGAYHPCRFSNTYLFYKEGWRGINIEPNPDCIAEFKRLRPEDLTLNVALADHNGTLSYCRFSNPLLNGFFSEDIVKAKVRKDDLVYLGRTNVQTLGVQQFLVTYANKDIDFLNIDVEGFESVILRNWDWQQFRPKLICAEIHAPSVMHVQEHQVHQILQSEGYVFISRIWQSSIFADKRTLRHRF